MQQIGDNHPTPVKLRQGKKLHTFDTSECKPQLPSDLSNNLNCVAMAGLHYLSGWLVKKTGSLWAKQKRCGSCIQFISATEPAKNMSQEWILTINKGNLMYVLHIIKCTEVIFENNSEILFTVVNLIDYIKGQLKILFPPPVSGKSHKN